MNRLTEKDTKEDTTMVRGKYVLLIIIDMAMALKFIQTEINTRVHFGRTKSMAEASSSMSMEKNTMEVGNTTNQKEKGSTYGLMVKIMMAISKMVRDVEREFMNPLMGQNLKEFMRMARSK